MNKVLLESPASRDSCRGEQNLAERSNGGHRIKPQQKFESSGGSSWEAEVPQREETSWRKNSEFVTRMWETARRGG